MAQQATNVMTIVSTGAGSKGRAVNWAGAQATAGQAICGIADHNFVSGEAIRVIVGVTADAVSGAAIDGSETRLVTDSQGRLIPWSTGVIVAARLIAKPGNVATAANQTVEVFPIQN